METKKLEHHAKELCREYDSWQPYFMELSKNFDPGRQRFNTADGGRHAAYNGGMIDPTPRLAARTLAAGLYAGATNPTVPWVSLRTSDPEMNKSHAVQVYTDEVSKRILYMLSRSNFYNIQHSVYTDIGIYGTSFMPMLSDRETVLRFGHKPVGSYRIGASARGDVDRYFEESKWTVAQIVDRFGIDNCPANIQTLYRSGQLMTLHTVKHLVMPRDEYDPSKPDAANMPFGSWYWLAGEQETLNNGGFKQLPATALRWEVLGNDSYGSFAPGMLVLGTARGLQKDQLSRYEAQDRMLRPTLNVPASMRNSGLSLMPGGVNYVPETAINQKIESAYNVNYPLNFALENIRDTREMINQGFFTDLFRMFADLNRSNITATQIAEMQGEKLVMLGPVINRVAEEHLDPVVSRSFYELERRGMLPEPPPELEDQELRIEYTSMLFQAQRLVEATGIERTVSFIGNLSAAKPEALDLLDVDSTIREYAAISGSNPKILASESAVEASRNQRQQAAMAQQAAESMQPIHQGAQAAELLSRTDTGGGQSALEAMLGSIPQ